MANEIDVTTAGVIRIVESIEQATLPAGETIVAGAPVRIDATTGNFMNGNATNTTEGNIYGVATRSVAAREPVTAVRKGVLDGFTLAGSYGDPVFISDTDARLSTVAGTQSIVAGFIVAATGQQLGTANQKLLELDIHRSTTHTHA